MRIRSVFGLALMASFFLPFAELSITSAGAASFQEIGIMVPPGVISGVSAVSADGNTVVGGDRGQAYRWTSSEGVSFLPDGGGLSPREAKAVSADGSVIVGFAWPGFGGNFRPFRWTAATGTLPLGNFQWGSSSGVSGDGNVVVGGGYQCCSLPPQSQAWSWTEAGGVVDLGTLNSGGSGAAGVSADGLVVIGGSGGEAFRWTQSSGMVGLGFLPGAQFLNSGANATSNDGSVIIGSSGSPLEAGIEPFRWTESSGMVGLGLLPGAVRGYGAAVSGDGTVIVGNMQFDNTDVEIREAFIWKKSVGLRNLKDLLMSDLGLDLNGWILKEATGISSDGLTIVGNGINPSGFSEPWIAKLDSQRENLNDKFAPLGPGDVATAFNRIPCGGAAVGTFTITATFTNISSDTLPNLVVAVNTLTGGNVLCNADGGPGGTGSQLTVPLVGDLADGQLAPGEAFVVELPIGLQSFNPFTFLVDVLGEEAP